MGSTVRQSTRLPMVARRVAWPWCPWHPRGRGAITIHGNRRLRHQSFRPGNAFVLLGEAGTPHDFTLNPFLVPSAPYAKGGHHFSNGATWVEQYASSVGLGDSVRPALATTDPACDQLCGRRREGRTTTASTST